MIGTGPGGQRAAIHAAKPGASVVAIESRSSIGGAAIHAGTIPSKTLREAALYLTGFRQRVPSTRFSTTRLSRSATRRRRSMRSTALPARHQHRRPTREAWARSAVLASMPQRTGLDGLPVHR
ncbi:MAG: FAD-dependent oxidoreductase [Chloroflexi bacterium]|nr:FAD-dependent oxidoreductase [Chloroflexota bacterium]